MTQSIKRQYTTEFKLESAQLADAVGSMEASRRLNVSDTNVVRWLKAYREGRLQAENNNLKQDNDILKKAAAYFVKTSR